MRQHDRTIDWFLFWLKDEEDPTPAKIDQYRRWRVLRQQQHGMMSKESSRILTTD